MDLLLNVFLNCEKIDIVTFLQSEYLLQSGFTPEQFYYDQIKRKDLSERDNLQMGLLF